MEAPARVATKLRVYVNLISQPSRAILIFCRIMEVKTIVEERWNWFKKPIHCVAHLVHPLWRGPIDVEPNDELMNGWLTYIGMNNIDFDLRELNLANGEHRSAEFKDVNPMCQVPAIQEGGFKLFESHAILKYLACSHPGVPDHWYPADVNKRAKIDSVLDWHHSNLRKGAAGLAFNRALAPIFNRPINPNAASEAEKILRRSLLMLDTFWLSGSGKFLVNSLQPSIADLSLACEIMQLQDCSAGACERNWSAYSLIHTKIRNRLSTAQLERLVFCRANLRLFRNFSSLAGPKQVLDPSSVADLLDRRENVKKWIDAVQEKTAPHFQEVHEPLLNLAESIQSERSQKQVSTATSKL